MNYYCHFHPSSPAKWQCNDCSRYYDNACLNSIDEKQQQASCPFCKNQLTYLPAEASFKKGGSELNELIITSLTFDNLALLLFSIGLACIPSLLDIETYLKFLLSTFVVLFINLHFGRKSIYLAQHLKLTGRRTKSSRTNAKKSSLQMLSMMASFQLTIVASILLILPVAVFYFANWFIGLILIFMAGLAFPYLMIFSFQSSENSHDLTFTKIVKELNPHTPKLALLSLCVYWLTLFLSDFAYQFDAPIITSAISGAMSMISLALLSLASAQLFIITCQKLSSKTTKSENHSAPKGPGSLYSQDQISNLDTDIDLALKTGDYLKVVSLLEEALKRNGRSNLRRQQLFLILYELRDFEKQARYAGLFLDWMLERNKVKEASQFIYQLRKHDPEFLLHDIGLMSTLAKEFLRTKKYALVLWLADAAQHRFPPSEELAAMILCAAQAFITHFQDLAKAEEYLLFIFQTCSEFPSAEAAKALLIHLQNSQKRQEELKNNNP